MVVESVFSVLPTNLNWLCVLIASMLPMIEIRGAIPFGLSTSVWGEHVLSLWQVCLLSFCGATISAFLVLLVLKLVLKIANKNKRFDALRGRITIWLDSKFFNYKQKGKQCITKKWFALMLFTGLPIPFSGGWSACLLALFLNMNYFSSLSAIVVGNLVATMLVSLFCTIFLDFVDLVFVVFVIITLMIIIYCFLSVLLRNLSKKHVNKDKICK